MFHYIRNLLFFALSSLLLCPGYILASEQHEEESFHNLPHEMKFKLGFEFQEGSSLCPWATNDYRMQRGSIFSVEEINSKQKLWKVVIDTNDIEFVTEPFSYKQQHLLEKCIDTMLRALKTLQTSINSGKQTNFESWLEALTSSLINENLSVEKENNVIYGLVKDKFFEVSERPWEPKFSPQVTVQHPLEFTIPLYYGLFGFDNPDMMDFSASLPSKDIYLKESKEATSTANLEKIDEWSNIYTKKINGLVFLHALTLVRMTPLQDQEDNEYLEETKNWLETSLQVDPKAKLILMSRRPFSSMLRDINFKESYDKYFETCIINNNNYFTSVVEVPVLFKKVNYAEQYFDSQTGAPRNLYKFRTFIDKVFYESNTHLIDELLAKGVISTTMIRNFKDEIKINNSSVANIAENYFNLSIKTIENPSQTYIINCDMVEVQAVPHMYDVLSPPCFLELDNSMGNYNRDLTIEEREYGEAIVEIRAIRDVQDWFLRKLKLTDDKKTKFLAIPENVKLESLKLFTFLRGFGMNKKDLEEIFHLGLPKAVKTY